MCSTQKKQQKTESFCLPFQKAFHAEENLPPLIVQDPFCKHRMYCQWVHDSFIKGFVPLRSGANIFFCTWSLLKLYPFVL